MLQACAQAVDFKVGHHFGEGQEIPANLCPVKLRLVLLLREVFPGEDERSGSLGAMGSEAQRDGGGLR
jgi:hypothetical protein